MDRGIRGPRPSLRRAGRWAALALVFLTLAAAPLAAETGPGPAQPPDVSSVTISPNPILPGPVLVLATAMSSTGMPVLAIEILVDSPFSTTPLSMLPLDGAFTLPREDAYWEGTYDDFGPGWHTLYVRATEDGAAWGPFAEAIFLAEQPATYGPVIESLRVTPEVSRGALLTIEADVVDLFAQPPWNSFVADAEFFIDRFAGDGNGTRLSGEYGNRFANVSWSGVPVLPGGTHTVYVHGRNTYGAWGPLAEAAFTVRTPSFLLSLAADRETALRDDRVMYTLRFANVGNANATFVWINVTLSPAVAYVADDAASQGGIRTGPTSYAFADVAPGARSFHVETRVLSDATDGAALDAGAALDYTNDWGWDYAPKAASVSGSVIAPEVAVAFSGPREGFAGETVTSSIALVHTGFRTIPSIDVALELSPWLDLVSDTAAGPGGISLGPGRWRFPDVAPGTLAFEVTERIRSDAVDGLPLPRSLTLAYTSRLGDFVLVPASYTMTVSRPWFTARAIAQPPDVDVDGHVGLSVEFANLGSATAREVHVRVSLPPQLALVGGDAPSAHSGADYAWVRQDVAPGPHAIALVLAPREPGAFALTFSVLYFSPNGAPLDIQDAPVLIVARERPPPIAAMYASFATMAALVAFAGFLATERGKTALLFLFVPLYTRLRHEKVLDHETRGMIRGYIVANPGDHYNSIKEALELPNGTLAYHIQVLEKESLVRSVKDGKFRRFYPYDMRVPESGEPTRIQKHILDLIRANPGLTPRDAAGLLGLTSSTVSYHLERLLELDKVEVRREGISKRLYVKGDLET